MILKVKELQDLKYKVNDIASILGMSNKTAISYSKISNENKEKYDKITNTEAKSSDILKSKEYLINKVKELSNKGKSMKK